MAKYRDKLKSQHEPQIVKRKNGEGWKERHRRRLQLNQERLDKFRKWVVSFGCEFRHLNGGEHWQVKHNGNCFDWWPRSAKLVINQRWKNGVHVHDYTQLIKYIENFS